MLQFDQIKQNNNLNDQQHLRLLHSVTSQILTVSEIKDQMFLNFLQINKTEIILKVSAHLHSAFGNKNTVESLGVIMDPRVKL